MATLRRAGFGSVFEVENEKVGIGTTGTATNTLQVLENIKSSDAKIIGLSTLTTYQGFVDKEAKLGNTLIDVESQAGTLGEVVIEGDVTVSSASTFTSSVNQLTLTDSFSVPTGNTDSRIHCQTAGSMRFNEDLGTLEFYTGDEWRTVNSIKDTGNRGRAMNMGGSHRTTGNTGTIDYINVQSKGNAQSFGDLVTGRPDRSGLANEIRGVAGGGNPSTNDIEYITMASEGNGIDFGNLTVARFRGSSVSNSTRGIFIGGRNPGNSDVMDYIQIMTLGDALDFGDLGTSGTRFNGTGSSPTRAVIASKEIDFITIASKGNSIEFGMDLFTGQYHQNGGSTGTRAMWAGGYSGPATSPYGVEVKTTSIRGVDIQSGGVATEYGNLVSNRGSHGSAYNYMSGTSDQTRAVWMGGYQIDPNQHVNNIDFFTMNSTGSAQDFGDLSQPLSLNTTCCDSHGGLGGI